MPAVAEQFEVHAWTASLEEYARNDESMRAGAARSASNEARLAIGRTDPSVAWRDLWAAATAPRYLDPVADAEMIREFIGSQQIDFDELLDSASKHFDSPIIHRRTEPLTPQELERLIEDDEHSISG